MIEEQRKILVMPNEPEDFNPKVQVAAIFVVVEEKLLLLQLSEKKQEPGAWGVPAGKLEANEDLMSGAARELFEETGIDMRNSSKLDLFGNLYIRKPEIDYVYHMLSLKLEAFPSVVLSEEHIAGKWAARHEIRQLRLMEGAEEILNYSPVGHIKYHLFKFPRR